MQSLLSSRRLHYTVGALALGTLVMTIVEVNTYYVRDLLLPPSRLMINGECRGAKPLCPGV